MTQPEDEIAALRAELAQLRREVADLRQGRTVPVIAGRISRAALLRSAGLAAAGVAAGAVALPAATPALADNGSDLIAGQDNQATATTSLTSSVLTDAALRVSNYYTGAIDDYSDALQAYTYGPGLAALYGRNDATGGSGVIGYSGNGVGGTFAGGEAPIRLQPGNAAGAPTSSSHQQGELYVDSNGVLWICTASGAPGTWSQVGGSSSSNGASGALDMARTYQKTSQGTANNTVTYLDLDSTPGTDADSWDTNGLVSTVSGVTRISIKTPGRYRINGSVAFLTSGSGGTGGVRWAIIGKNGSTFRTNPLTESDISVPWGFVSVPIQAEAYLQAGDYITLGCYQNSGSTVNTDVGGENGYGGEYSFLEVERIDGYAINPMTAPNDLIVGGANGLPTRLGATASAVLATDGSGNVGWVKTAVGAAQQSTATNIPNGSYATMQLDGASVLNGGATIDNTGMAGNGITPGTAGTYLIIGAVSTTDNDGTWIQAGWAKNGATASIAMMAGSSGQSGATITDIAALSATDVVNLVAQAGTAVTSFPGGTRLLVIRLF